jgi:hypothetical protein
LIVQQAIEDKDLQGRRSLKNKRQFSDDKPRANLSKYGPAPEPKKNRSTTSSVYCNICKSAGKPEITRDCLNNTNLSGKDLERKLRNDFKGRARGNTASDSYYTGSGGYSTLGWTKMILEINIARR